MYDPRAISGLQDDSKFGINSSPSLNENAKQVFGIKVDSNTYELANATLRLIKDKKYAFEP